MAVKIGLDAGHGLKTSGKQTPDGIKEWTLNDKVRDKVVNILADYDCEIINTDNNEGKTDESLSSRLSTYMKKDCAVFVSIHHNANTGKWNNATGVEIFTDNNPTAKDNELAKCIYTRLVKNTGMKGRGIKKCDFYVINQDKIPAVLVEGGFMDGREDYKIITSDKGQTAYAKAVAEGLIDFLNLKKKKASTTKKPAATTTKKPETTATKTKQKIASGTAKKQSRSLSGTYKVTGCKQLHVRDNASTKASIMVIIPKGTEVQNYGYYSEYNGTKWLYIQFRYKDILYTGFASSKYLKKVK